MRRTFAALLFAVSLLAAPEPVTWSAQIGPAAVRAGGRFSVKVTAKIQDGWHLYSMKPLSEGPIPTRVWIAEGQPFSIAGPVAATEPRAVHDASFGMEVELYEGAAEFTLPARVAAGAPAGVQRVAIYASYQVCDNRICLPPKTVKLEAPVTVTR